MLQCVTSFAGARDREGQAMSVSGPGIGKGAMAPGADDAASMTATAAGQLTSTAGGPAAEVHGAAALGIGARGSGGGATRDLCPTPVMPDKQRAIVRILSTATDAASFDRIYFRLNPQSLLGAVTGAQDDAVRAMIAKFHGSATPGDWAGYSKYL